MFDTGILTVPFRFSTYLAWRIYDSNVGILYAASIFKNFIVFFANSSNIFCDFLVKLPVAFETIIS